MTREPQDLVEYQTDHDLLILLNERVGNLTKAVGEKTGDHETRIRYLEMKVWLFTGAASILGTIGGTIVPKILGI